MTPQSTGECTHKHRDKRIYLNKMAHSPKTRFLTEKGT